MNEANKKRAYALAGLARLELNGYTNEAQKRKEMWLQTGRTFLRAFAKELGLNEF